MEIPAPASAERPYTVVNMVSSVDGRSSLSGQVSGMGGAADRAAMRALRSRVDAVMVGAGTVRAEKINLGLDDPGAGQPLAVVVGGTGDVPLDEHLVRRDQDLILALPEGSSANRERPQERATVLRLAAPDESRVDLRALLRVLRGDHGVERLLVEGGPTINGALISAGLVDEIFLTLAPRLVLGPESAIASGDALHRDLELLSVHAAGCELFLRYRIENSR